MPVIIALIGLSGFLLYRTHVLHKKRSEKQNGTKSTMARASSGVLKACDEEVQHAILEGSLILIQTYTNFFKEKHKELKQLRKQSKKLAKEIKQIREEIPNTLKKFEENDLERGHFYVQVVTYMVEMCNSLSHIVQPAFNHLDNNHAFDKEQNRSIMAFADQMKAYFAQLVELLKHRKYDQLDALVLQHDKLIQIANEILYNRVKIIKKKQKGVKVSVTYIEMITETKNFLLNALHLVKANIKLMNSFASAANPGATKSQ